MLLDTVFFCSALSLPSPKRGWPFRLRFVDESVPRAIGVEGERPEGQAVDAFDGAAAEERGEAGHEEDLRRESRRRDHRVHADEVVDAAPPEKRRDGGVDRQREKDGAHDVVDIRRLDDEVAIVAVARDQLHREENHDEHGERCQLKKKKEGENRKGKTGEGMTEQNRKNIEGNYVLVI